MLEKFVSRREAPQDACRRDFGAAARPPIAFSERFESNWDLSAARASAVADYFMDAGRVTEERISVLGFADTKPIASNDNPTGRAQNRRIEILVDN